MSDIRQRLARMALSERARAFAAIGEVVWWVTIVDATLVRHHLEAYDGVMSGQTDADRQLTEETLAGLRFMRNRIGGDPDPGDGHVTSWT